jgi:hypothetical protein
MDHPLSPFQKSDGGNCLYHLPIRNPPETEMMHDYRLKHSISSDLVIVVAKLICASTTDVSLRTVGNQ